MDASNLHEKFVGNFLEFIHLQGKLRQSDVDWCSQGGSQVGGAWGDVTQVTIMGELGNLLDEATSTAESFEDGVQVSSLLHRDNSELIFFVDPDEESLFLIVEDTSAMGPVSVQVACF